MRRMCVICACVSEITGDAPSVIIDGQHRNSFSEEFIRRKIDRL